LWGHPVGQSHTEGFIARLFTVRVSSERPVKKGSCVIAVQSFNSSELEWPPDKPPLLSLEAGRVMQLVLDEESGDEWMFGHPCHRPSSEGFFPAGYTLPILMDTDFERKLASHAMLDARDDVLESHFVMDGLAFESSPRCRSDIRHLCTPSPTDSRSTTASYREPYSSTKGGVGVSGKGMPENIAHAGQYLKFEDVVANSSRNILRKRAGLFLCQHLRDRSLEAALTKLQQNSVAPTPPPHSKHLPISDDAAHYDPKDSPPMQKAVCHSPVANDYSPMQKAVLACPTARLLPVELKKEDDACTPPLTPVGACSGIGCMVARYDFDPSAHDFPHKTQGCLSFKKGQHVYAMLEDPHGEWSWGYMASKPELEGIFPTSYAVSASKAYQIRPSLPKINSSRTSTVLSANRSLPLGQSHQNKLSLAWSPIENSDESMLSDTTLLPVGINSDESFGVQNSFLFTGSTQPESEPMDSLLCEHGLPQRPPPLSWADALVVSDEEFARVVQHFDPQSVKLPLGHEQARLLKEGQVMRVLHQENKCGDDWCWGHPLGSHQLFCCFPRSCVQAMPQRLQSGRESACTQTRRPQTQSTWQGSFRTARLPPLPGSAPALLR